MKGIAAFVLMAALLLIPAGAMAQDKTEFEKTELPEPGITPDNPLFFMDVFFDDMSLNFDFNQDSRIEKMIQIARERVSEGVSMAEKGNVQAMGIAVDEHGKILSRLGSEMGSIDDSDSMKAFEKEVRFGSELLSHEGRIEDAGNEVEIEMHRSGRSQEQIDTAKSLVASLLGQVKAASISTDNEKQKTRIELGQKTGLDDIARVEKIAVESFNGVSVKAETLDGKTQVKVYVEFQTTESDANKITQMVVDRLKMDSDKASALLRIQEDRDSFLDDERFRVRAKDDNGVKEVRAELRFNLDTVDPAAIVGAIVQRTQLSEGQINGIMAVSSGSVKEFDVRGSDESELRGRINELGEDIRGNSDESELRGRANELGEDIRGSDENEVRGGLFEAGNDRSSGIDDGDSSGSGSSGSGSSGSGSSGD